MNEEKEMAGELHNKATLTRGEFETVEHGNSEENSHHHHFDDDGRDKRTGTSILSSCLSVIRRICVSF